MSLKVFFCLGPSLTGMYHYFWSIADRCPWQSISYLLFLSISQLLPTCLSSFLTSSLYRSSSSCLRQHQRVSLLAGMPRGMGDGPKLQLALRESCHHPAGGKSLQGWKHADGDHESHLWPIHLHGWQQVGIQLCHIHSRYDYTFMHVCFANISKSFECSLK